MDDDRFNMSLRKFLKKVGVTSQREIERAVEAARAAGRLRGDESLAARVTLKIAAIDLELDIEGDIELA